MPQDRYTKTIEAANELGVCANFREIWKRLNKERTGRGLRELNYGELHQVLDFVIGLK